MLVAKSFSQLTALDLVAFSVWRHKAGDNLGPGEDESWVEPVTELPISDAFDHYFAVAVTLADGTTEKALVGKTEPSSPQINEKNQLFVFFRGTHQHQWTNSPPWFKPEIADPAALAALLGRAVDEVFPFTYDLNSQLVGHPNVLRRSVVPIAIARTSDAVEVALAAAEEQMSIVRNRRK